MSKIRDIIAILAFRFFTFAGKLAGKMSTSAPGGIALKISPNILKNLSKQLSGPIVFVCGTNGKTTTNNLYKYVVDATKFIPYYYNAHIIY